MRLSWFLIYGVSQLILARQHGATQAVEQSLLLPQLLDWFQRITIESEGGYSTLFDNINKHLSLETSIDSGVRGIHLISKIEVPTSSNLAVAIPIQSIMSSTSARDQSRSEPLSRILRKKKYRNINDDTILVAHLQCELSKGNASWWWPYLATLPDQVETHSSSALFWDDDTLSDSPTLLEHIMSKRAERDQAKKEASQLFSSTVLEKGCGGDGWAGATFDDAFDEAYALVSARATSGLPGIMKGDVSVKCLTPLLDLLNHRRGEARYLELYGQPVSSSKQELEPYVFGVGIQAPPGGYAIGEEIFHDYEGGFDVNDQDGNLEWWSDRHKEMMNCHHEMLASYGFIDSSDMMIRMNTTSNCALLPWVGTVRERDLIRIDASPSPVVEMCRGELSSMTSQADQVKLSQALRWEIEHDYKQLASTLPALQARVENLDDELQAACIDSDGESGECEKRTEDTIENRRRQLNVLTAAQGELHVLQLLHRLCNQDDFGQKQLSKKPGQKKKRKKSSGRKKL